MFEAEKRLKSRSTIIDYFLPTEIGHRCVHHLQNIWRAPARIRNRTHCILPCMFFTGVELPILVPHPKYQNNESAHRCPFVHDKPRDKTLRVIPASSHGIHLGCKISKVHRLTKLWFFHGCCVNQIQRNYMYVLLFCECQLKRFLN